MRAADIILVDLRNALVPLHVLPDLLTSEDVKGAVADAVASRARVSALLAELGRAVEPPTSALGAELEASLALARGGADGTRLAAMTRAPRARRKALARAVSRARRSA